MKDAFFKTAARPRAFGFSGAPLDRISERREDAGAVAALRERADARAVLIARDMPILPRGAAPRDPLFPLRAVAALGGARFEALLGIDARGAPVFAALARRRRGRGNRRSERRLPRPAHVDRSRPRRSGTRRSAHDRRARPGFGGSARHSRSGQGDFALARPPRPLRQLRRADADRRRGLAARMRRLQGAAFSPHRPGRHHARGRRRALPARPSGALSQGHVFVPRRLRRTRRDDRRSGQARNPRGGRRSPAAKSPMSPRSPGRSRPR